MAKTKTELREWISSGFTRVEDVAYVGGGSLPDQALKTCVIEIAARRMSETEMAYFLRTGAPAVISRLRDNKLVLDVRTIFPEQEELVAEAVRQALMDH